MKAKKKQSNMKNCGLKLDKCRSITKTSDDYDESM